MELTLAQAVQKGVEAHKAGQIQDAERLYTAILQTQPKHPDVNHNMGVLAVGVGKVQDALPFFKAALEAKPSVAQFWLSYIDALIKLGQIVDAKAVLDQAKDKGASGEAFDQLEKRLFKPSANSQDPPTEELQSIINLYTQGQLQKALSYATQMQKRFPNLAVLYNIAGASNAGLMQFDAAIASYKQAIKIKPDFAQAYNNMGSALYDQGDPEAAIDSYRQALKINPNYAEVYNNIGNALNEKGDVETAIDSYKQALKINPDFFEVYFNLGIAQNSKGDVETAIDSYRQALKIKPDYAEVYNNIGNALNEKGDVETAIDSYKQALKIKPDYAEAYNNMGTALQKKEDLESALDSYQRALKIKPDYTEAYNNIGIALKGVVFNRPNSRLLDTITLILESKNCVRPVDIFKAAISLLKFEPSIKELFKKHSIGKVKQSLETMISDLCEVPLLFKLISVCPLPDLELEVVLTDLRSALLLSISEISGSPEILRFQSALALQCFTNDYLYNQIDKETKLLTALEAIVEQTLLKGGQPRPQLILCLASYKALHQYKWCEFLTVNASIKEVFARQVLEPKREVQLKSDISVLQGITAKVSLKVREMYEESPYPRWVNLGLPLKSAPISSVTKKIKLKLFDKTINEIEAPNILIAGCGTGLHSIDTASRFKDAKVLAVDLSFSSLAYAKRKTEELDLQNIDYMQADILDLGKLDRKFDIIESVGVLHHMNDPMVGWRVLTDCLKSGGLMSIGLYSTLARQHIIRMREEINQSGIGSSDLAMKSFRNNVIKSEKDHHKQILPSDDFYSLSTLRDLLFHVQEHRFTIPQIQESLDELGLKFCGFESSRIVYNFKLTYTRPDDPYDLDKWQSYEEANPRCFAGMYQFWCQKVV